MFCRRVASHHKAFKNVFVHLAFFCALCLHGVNSYAEEPAILRPPSFHVQDVVQDAGKEQIIITFHVGAAANVVIVPYLPGPQKAAGSYWNEPACQASDDICCLQDFKDNYVLPVNYAGEFQDVCGPDGTTIPPTFISSKPSGSLLQQNVQDRMQTMSFSDFALTTVRDSQDQYLVTMSVPIAYFESTSNGGSQHALVQPQADGEFSYDLFVGVVFLTPQKSSNDVLVHSVQETIRFSKSNYLFFSTTTQQDRTPVKSVNAFIHQGLKDNNKLQYIEMEFEYDTTQYNEGVTIPKDSIKLFKGDSSTLANPSHNWRLPCDEFSMMQDSSFWTGLNTLTCLPEMPVICPASFTYTLFLPLYRYGGTGQGDFLIEAPEERELSITMQLEFVNNAGEPVQTTIFVAIDLRTYPVLEHCTEKVPIITSLKDIVSVKFTTGVLDATKTDFTPPSGTQFVLDNRLIKFGSYESAALSIKFDMNNYLNTNLVEGDFISVDDMVILNLLTPPDDQVGAATRYNAMTNLLATNQLFRVNNQDPSNYKVEFASTESVTACPEIFDTYTTVTNYQCMFRRIISNNLVTAVGAESVFYMKNKANDLTAFTTWFKNAYSGISSAFAYRERLCDTNSATGSFACIFIDPGYRWLSRSDVTQDFGPSMTTFDISDKTIVAGIITIRSGPGNNVIRRRLFSVEDNQMQIHGDVSDYTSETGEQEIVRQEIAEQEFKIDVLGEKAGTEFQKYTALENVEARHRLHNSHAASRARDNSNVKRFDRVQMRKDAWESHGIKTKVTTFGGLALSRHLLEDGNPIAQEVQWEEIKKMPSAQAYSTENHFVNAPVNIAHMTGHANRHWQMFSATVKIDANVDKTVFIQNLQTVLSASTGLLGSNVETGKIVGWNPSVDTGMYPGTAAGSRRLLAPTPANGLSVSIDLQGILGMNATFGALYDNMFKCIIHKTSTMVVNITVVNAAATAKSCASPENAKVEVEAVQSLLLSVCGIGHTTMSKKNCNILYSALVLTAPTIAFDWLSVRNTNPVLTFKMQSPVQVDGGNDGMVIYTVRKNIALALTVPMDRVMVQVRDVNFKPAARRLLATEKQQVLVVWVYPEDTSRNFPAFPPAAITNVAQTYQTSYRKLVLDAVLPVLNKVSIDTSLTPVGTVKPFQPLLKEFAIVATVQFDMKAVATFDSRDINEIHEAIKAEFATTLKVLPMDMRVLSTMTHTDKPNRRFTAIELRFLNEADAKADILVMKKLAPQMSVAIKTSLNTQTGFEVEKITITQSGIMFEEKVEDSSTTMWLIAGVIILCLGLLVCLCTFLVKSSNDAANTEKGTEINEFQPSAPPLQQAGGGQESAESRFRFVPSKVDSTMYTAMTMRN